MDVYVDNVESNEKKELKKAAVFNNNKELSGNELKSTQKEDSSVPVQSKRASMRRFANAACHSNSFARAPALGSSNPSLGASASSSTLPSKDTLPDIEGRLELWKAEHPGALSSQIAAIESALSVLEGVPGQDNGSALRKFIEENPVTKQIFSPDSIKGLDPDAVQSLYNALNFSRTVPQSPDKPPIDPGYVPFVLNGLKPDQTIRVVATIKAGPKTGQQYIHTFTQSEMKSFVGSDGKTHLYIDIPRHLDGGRIYLSDNPDPNDQTYVEFSTVNQVFVDFTGVDGIPLTPASIQVNDQAVAGLSFNRKKFVSDMEALYGSYGLIGKEWLANMFNSYGIVNSGKNMPPSIYANDGNPRHMGTYLETQFLPGLENKKIYITKDFFGSVQKILDPKTQKMKWAFVPDPSCSGSKNPVFFPDSTSPEGWIAGADGGLQYGKWDYKSNPEAANVAMALTGLVNNGILPSDVHTSASNPLVGGGYFTNIENVKNFYKAPFYNVYLRCMHEAGASGYGVDYDEQNGGDGGEGGDRGIGNNYVTITFGQGSTPPTPSNLDKIKKEAQAKYNSVYTQFQNAQNQYKQAYANYQQALNAYNSYSGPNKAQVQADLNLAKQKLDQAISNLSKISKGDLAKAQADLAKVLNDKDVAIAQKDLETAEQDDQALTSDISAQVTSDLVQAQNQIDAANQLMNPTPSTGLDKLLKEIPALGGLFSNLLNQLRGLKKGSGPYNDRVVSFHGGKPLHELNYLSLINSILSESANTPERKILVAFMKNQGFPINATGADDLAKLLVQDEIKHLSPTPPPSLAKIKEEAQNSYKNALSRFTSAQKQYSQAYANYNKALNALKSYTGPNKAEVQKDLNQAYQKLMDAKSNLDKISSGDLAKAKADLDKVLSDQDVATAQKDLKVAQADDQAVTTDITSDQIQSDISEAQKQIDAANQAMKPGPKPPTGLDKLLKEVPALGSLFDNLLNQLRGLKKGSGPYNDRVVSFNGGKPLHELNYLSLINSILTEPATAPDRKALTDFMKSQGFPINATGADDLAKLLVQDEIKHLPS